MIGILALILFVLMLVIGGERGATSVMALAGNIIVLAFTIIFLARGHSPFFILFFATVAISCVSLFGQNGIYGCVYRYVFCDCIDLFRRMEIQSRRIE